MAFRYIYRFFWGWDTASPPAEPSTACQRLNNKYRQVDFLFENESHYGLVIHGTFDAPNPNNNPIKWYQLERSNPKNFCTMLEHGVAHVVGARWGDKEGFVWRELPGAPSAALARGVEDEEEEEAETDHREGFPAYPFRWDGQNDSKSRISAGIRLAKLFRFISIADPSARIHVVAHSHGGNVLLKAVEKYMKELSAQPQESWHPAIRESFWTSYSTHWRLAERWMKCPAVAWYRRLWPFLVLRRTLTGEVTRGLERYPYAYYKWCDDLLGLGAVRQQIYLRHRKASSPVSNALGSLVFLGTPFLVRRWSSWGVASLALRILVKSFLAGLLLWLYVFLALTVSSPSSVSQFEWFVGLVALGPIALVAVAFFSISVLSEVTFRSGNLYHNTRFNWSSAMPCLVAHAGMLDEASMGLSAEPVVEALLVPELKELMEANMWRSWPRRPPPSRARHPWKWATYAARVLFSLYINILGLVPLLQKLASVTLAPFFADKLKVIAMQLVLGLPAIDFTYGHIYVERMLRLPVAAVTHWNVQQLIAARGEHRDGFHLMLENGEQLDMREFVQVGGEKGAKTPALVVSAGPGDLPDSWRLKAAVQGNGDRGSAAEEPGQESDPQTINSARAASKPQRAAACRQGGQRKEGQPRDKEAHAALLGHGVGAPCSCAPPDAWIISLEHEGAGLGRAAVCSGDRPAPPPALVLAAADSVAPPGTPLTGDEVHASEGLGCKGAAGAPENAESLGSAVQQSKYSFLWDPQLLEAEARKSLLFQRLRHQVSRLRRNPDLTQGQFVGELEAICVMFERRLEQILGQYELSHSLYFREPTIAYALAHFIMRQELPPWAHPDKGLLTTVSIEPNEAPELGGKL